MNKKQKHRLAINKIYVANVASTADRDTDYNDYGAKHDLPDFYGAGLVRRMAKDISTVYA